MPDICDLSFDLVSLRAAYAAGLAPREVVREVYRRIRALDDPGVFLSLVEEDAALAQADSLGAFDPGRPLWGAPFAVKDNIDVAGLPTTAACPAFAFTPPRHAHAVALLESAGAIVIGKTNLDQFATGLVGVRTPYPAPRNAFDAAMVPGGSSSGSAVAVAQGLVSFSLGTDTAGSGRVPAGLNNLVGLKPTLGAVSARGMLPACRTLDTISVFALTVADAWDAFAAIAVYDADDPFARPLSLPPRLGAAPPHLRLAIPDAAGLVFHGDALARRAFARAVEDARALGAQIVEIDMRAFFDAARLLYEGPWVAERYAAMREVMEQRPDILHPTTRAIVEGARRFSAADAFAARYRLAELRRESEAVWSRVDALLVPTFPRPRSLADLAADPIGPNSELGTYTNFVNLLDLCAIAAPTALREDGFPNGATLIAPAGRDALIASFAAALQERCAAPLGATGRPQPPSAPGPLRANGEEIELAVVGAHLSGMALNAELTSLGARLLRAGPTTPDYRLFALPGGPPRRPGLLRVADGAGFPIETEVWALTPAAFGRFVAGVPAPLGIGVTRLADGTRPKGFLVESVAVEGAQDISSWGGWRAWCAAA